MPLAAFVYLTATIVVLASERVYWYWAGFNPESALFLGAFYLIPTMAGLWALALAPARRIHHVVLAGAIFAFVVEGVLTPIIYIDGPLPGGFFDGRPSPPLNRDRRFSTSSPAVSGCVMWRS